MILYFDDNECDKLLLKEIKSSKKELHENFFLWLYLFLKTQINLSKIIKIYSLILYI